MQVLTNDELEQFERDGFFVARGLFSRDEIQQRLDHLMQLHENGPVEKYFNPQPLAQVDGDLLRAYPRVLHPHRWDEVSKAYLLEARLAPYLADLLGEEPLAAQSMFYFKPPGARGQALHQDDFYLRTGPSHCMAAWLALDATDEENGGLFVVPGSHRSNLQCPHAADLRKSFTIEEVNVPQGLAAVPMNLAAGDMLFFNGAVIHGSQPNSTSDRFRRSFICHYVPRSTQVMAQWYSPLWTFNGEAVEVGGTQSGGPCGTEELEMLRTAMLSQGELAQTAIEQGAVA